MCVLSIFHSQTDKGLKCGIYIWKLLLLACDIKSKQLSQPVKKKPPPKSPLGWEKNPIIKIHGTFLKRKKKLRETAVVDDRTLSLVKKNTFRDDLPPDGESVCVKDNNKKKTSE